jgi:NhaA family Na+:H+ antiporter
LGKGLSGNEQGDSDEEMAVHGFCAILSPVPARPPRNRVEHAWTVARDNSLLMVAGAVAALVWANLAPASYQRWTGPLHFAVNDVAMVFFFGVAMKEIIEATAPGGALHSLRRAALPVIAAVGGMAGPALLYVAQAGLLGRPDILGGWAIPCATDIAFSYLVVRVIFPAAHPAIPFLLLLAIADDALGLVLLAAFYPVAPLRPLIFLGLVATACVVAWALRRRAVNNFWPYVVVAGGLSWVGFYVGGLHPALALVPVLPFMPHAAHDPGLLVEPHRPPHDALNAFDHWWSTPVEIVLFFFALTNAGVPLASTGTATWIVLASLVFGKPIGIAAATWTAERVGFRRPHRLTWPDVGVLGIAAGIGFTVALFFATAAFPPGLIQEQAKLGALLSVVAGALAILAGRLFAGART